MQVENIECQIAQAQIGNFLAGSGLSQDAMEQLEDHIAGCPGCKAVLNERRSELKAMLTGQKAVVDFEKIAQEAEATKAKSIATALRKKSLQQMLEPAPAPAPVPTPKVEAPVAKAVTAVVEETAPQVADAKTKSEKKPNQVKSLIYSLALAGVLVAMSLFSGNIAQILGPKLSESNLVASAAPVVTETNPAPESPSESLVSPDSTSATTASVVSENPNVPQTTTPPAAPTGDEVAVLTPTASAGSPEAPAVTEPNPVNEEAGVLVAEVAGRNIGDESTTQFQAPTPEAPQPQVVQPTPKAPAKPVIKQAPAKKVVAKRIVRRKPIRRIVAKKPAPVKSRGIKVYNP